MREKYKNLNNIHEIFFIITFFQTSKYENSKHTAYCDHIFRNHKNKNHIDVADDGWFFLLILFKPAFFVCL